LSREAGDTSLAARLAGHRVVLCRGFLGEVLAGLRPLGVDYLGLQAFWLRGLGLSVLEPPLPSAAPIMLNGAQLARLITAEASPVLLIGHSKGGLEGLAALLRPGVAAHVMGFIALQAPFLGSPVADWVCGQTPLHRVSGIALSGLGLGSGQGVRDLTVATRRAWMHAHATRIAALAVQLPMTSVATVLPPTARGAYAVIGRRLERLGWGPNDGLVPVTATILPGARHETLRGDHRALVSRGRGQDPVAVLRNAIRTTLTM
jgi:hypothetical protein